MRVRGTVKVAVLRGDLKCPELLCVSVYDTKPVNFLSMSADSVRWIRKERKAFNPDRNKEENIKFLRLNINDDYNNYMGSVNLADQLRNTYCMDHWMQQRKWWRSAFLWGVGVLLTNAYLCYRSFHKKEGTLPGNVLSSYEFRRAIALDWMDPSEDKRPKSALRK